LINILSFFFTFRQFGDIIPLMKISKFFLATCLLYVVFLLSSCTLPFVGKKKKAALQVTSDSKATVFLNDEHVGQTPYFDENLKPGEYSLKLIPETTEPSLLSWQGMLKLSSGILTVVNRSFGETEEFSSGYVLSLEPIAEKEAVRISIISTPDSVVVSLDGEPKGFTPLSLDGIDEGEHLLTISSSGYKEEVIKAKTVKGHKLVVNVQLAKEKKEEAEEEDEEATESAEKSSSSDQLADSEDKEEDETEEEETTETEEEDEMERPYVKIKDNPWGYLNVRSEPSTAGGAETVVVKVDLGDVFKYIETSDNGWYKIEYEEDKMGWVSGKYTKLYE